MKVYVQSHGCSLNSADSERIVGLLEASGFTIVGDPDDAEIVIINSCTVKTPTVKKIKKSVKEYQMQGKGVVLAGCIPQAEPNFIEDVSMIGPSQIKNIVEIVEETINGNNVKLLVVEDDKKLAMPVIRKNEMIEILPVSEGCLGDPCSYCLVKKARGHLKSRSPELIINRIKKSVVYDRVKEIWLTSQDMGCYGFDIGTNIVELVVRVLEIPGEFKVRLGMANPNHVLGLKEELVEVFKHPKMFKFLHIPLQSGNDDVLKKMKRKYIVSEFKEIIEFFRRKVPDITISTDIICGFPEETNIQFKDSIELVREIKPEVLNISKFWLRPGTDAEKLEQVPNEEIKNRSRLMTDVFNWTRFKSNDKWIGRTCRVIVDEKGKAGTNSMIGRNESYKTVILKGSHEIGEFVNVKIVDAIGYDLIGKEI